MLARVGAGILFLGVATSAAGALLLLRQAQPGGRAPVRHAPHSSGKTERSPYGRSNVTLSIVLLVTVVMNIGYYSHMPLIPALADRYSNGASMAGIVAAASGVGMFIGAVSLLALVRRVSPWRVYFGGSVLALIGLAGASLAQTAPLAIAGLAVAGVGVSGFVTMQAVLVAEAAPVGELGGAMGRMSTAIGVLPFAMILVGATADLTTPGSAVLAASLIGLTLLLSLPAIGVRRTTSRHA